MAKKRNTTPPIEISNPNVDDKIIEGVTTLSDLNHELSTFITTQVPGDFATLIEQVTGIKTFLDEDLIAILQAQASESGGSPTDVLLPGGPPKAAKKTPVSLQKINRINQLTLQEGLGSAIIYWKLHEIHLDLKKWNGGGAKKGGGIGDIFKGLLAGAVGLLVLAAALIIFAGALVLFGIVKWGPALFGMLAFTLFVIGAILLAKLVSKNLKNFILLAVGSILLSVALIAFAVALYVAAWAMPYTLRAIPAIILFIAFTFITIQLAKQMGDKGTIQKFLGMAVGAVLMSVALIVFSLSLFVAAWAKNFVVAAIPAVLLFLGFVTIIMILANVLGDKGTIQKFKDMAIGSMLMSVGLVVFAIAIFFTAIMGPYVSAALPIVAMFAGFVIIMGVFATLVKDNGKNFIYIAIGGILIAVGLVLFGFAIRYTALQAPFVTAALPVIGLFAGFIIAYGVLGILAQSNGINILFVALAAILIGVGLITFAYTLRLAGEITVAQVLLGVVLFRILLVFMAAFALIGFFAAPALPFVANAGLAALAVGGGLLAFALALKIAEKINIKDVTKSVQMINALIPLMFAVAFMGVVAPAAILGAVAMVIVGLLLVPAIAAFWLASKTMLLLQTTIHKALPAIYPIQKLLVVMGLVAPFAIAAMVGSAALLATSVILQYAFKEFAKAILVLWSIPINWGVFYKKLGYVGAILTSVALLGYGAAWALPGTIIFAAWALATSASFIALGDAIWYIDNALTLLNGGLLGKISQAKESIAQVKDLIANEQTGLKGLFNVISPGFLAKAILMSLIMPFVRQGVEDLAFAAKAMPKSIDSSTMITLTSSLVNISLLGERLNDTASALRNINQALTELSKNQSILQLMGNALNGGQQMNLNVDKNKSDKEQQQSKSSQGQQSSVAAAIADLKKYMSEYNEKHFTNVLKKLESAIDGESNVKVTIKRPLENNSIPVKMARS